MGADLASVRNLGIALGLAGGGMHSIFRLLVGALLALALFGCPASAGQVQAQVADTVATSANTLLPMLVAAYRQEGLDAIERVKQAGGTKTEALEAVQDVEVEWRPVWLAWESLRSAHDAWSDQLEAGGAPRVALLSAHEAYCNLMAVWPKRLVAPVQVIPCALGEP